MCIVESVAIMRGWRQVTALFSHYLKLHNSGSEMKTCRDVASLRAHGYRAGKGGGAATESWREEWGEEKHKHKKNEHVRFTSAYAYVQVRTA